MDLTRRTARARIGKLTICKRVQPAGQRADMLVVTTSICASSQRSEDRSVAGSGDAPRLQELGLRCGSAALTIQNGELMRQVWLPRLRQARGGAAATARTRPPLRPSSGGIARWCLHVSAGCSPAIVPQRSVSAGGCSASRSIGRIHSRPWATSVSLTLYNQSPIHAALQLKLRYILRWLKCNPETC